MISRLHLTAIVVIAVISIAVTRLIAGETISLGWFTSIGTAVAVNVIALTAFNLWLWRWDIWQGWFVNRPHIWGEWDVTLESRWVDPETGKQKDPISATLSIKQSYASVHTRVRTPESKGDLVDAKIVEGKDARYTLIGIYQNDPDLAFREASPMHYGAFMLEIEGAPNTPNTLRGHYWTDRQTTGQMTAVRRLPAS